MSPHAGLAWFTDLTVPDPLYILPVVNSALLLASIEVRRAPSPSPVRHYDIGLTSPRTSVLVSQSAAGV
jgi:membrane protein insertase Oxa1/YidC/SpoIIIJ